MHRMPLGELPGSLPERFMYLTGKMLLPGFVEGHIHSLVGARHAEGLSFKKASVRQIGTQRSYHA